LSCCSAHATRGLLGPQHSVPASPAAVWLLATQLAALKPCTSVRRNSLQAAANSVINTSPPTTNTHHTTPSHTTPNTPTHTHKNTLTRRACLKHPSPTCSYLDAHTEWRTHNKPPLHPHYHPSNSIAVKSSYYLLRPAACSKPLPPPDQSELRRSATLSQQQPSGHPASCQARATAPAPAPAPTAPAAATTGSRQRHC